MNHHGWRDDARAADELSSLARWLGDEARDLAVLGEGNVSMRLDAERMLVKASGSALAAATPDTLVEVRLRPLLELLDTADADDEDVQRVLLGSRADGEEAQPSVEALLHAVSLTDGGASVVAHTHPQSVNAIVCSDRAPALVAGALFPDQIVVLGREQILVPYVDPGLDLGRAVRAAVRDYRSRWGDRPRAIYLANHGFVALGDSADEARRITVMADKVARVLRDTLAIGEPRYLGDEFADRIHTRPDEMLRRRVLDGRSGPASFAVVAPR
ncbi:MULTISPECIES: class II aldolase/adducin family protein [unclassified Micromonospora]|uniref:class II aldolase/adducin family protein n=1 Tax=unclassified Micromonospora TaxID=2617518 RepID=UPI003317DBF7